MSSPSHRELLLARTNASQLLTAVWLFRTVAYRTFIDVQRPFTTPGSQSKSSGSPKPSTSCQSITQHLVLCLIKLCLLFSYSACLCLFLARHSFLRCVQSPMIVCPWKALCVLAPKAPFLGFEQTRGEARS